MPPRVQTRDVTLQIFATNDRLFDQNQNDVLFKCRLDTV